VEEASGSRLQENFRAELEGSEFLMIRRE